MIDLEKMAEAAEKATPGEYEYYLQGDGDGWLGLPGRHGDLFFSNPVDAEYISLANPQTILKLIAVVRASKKVVEHWNAYQDYWDRDLVEALKEVK